MKDEQKVWIRGVEGRGSEVIKMLTNLGAENTWHSCGSDPGCIYFIRHDGTVGDAAHNSERALMVKEYCRELHLPEQWKDGDVLINAQISDIFAVCKSACNTRDEAYHCYMYADFGCDEIDAEGCDILRSTYRLATPSEVERFHDILHRHGKYWDAEQKELIDIIWKPKNEETYYFIDTNTSVYETAYDDNNINDFLNFEVGNCFRTREEAEVMAEKVKKLLKGE